MKTRLQQLREEKNISQIEIANVLEVTRQAYSRYERGERELGYGALIKLAKYFDVSIDYLLINSDFYYPGNNPNENKNLIERPPYEITDKQTLDIVKLCKVMNEIQKAQVFGYVVALLEQAGVNVQAVLRN